MKLDTSHIDERNKKIIAVIGATGKQGGGLVRAMLKDTALPFHIRALTRHPDKESALAMKDEGVEVMPFDMDGSPRDMAKVLEGVYGLFVVTNYWEHYDQEREAKQAQAVITAGEMAGVEHYVWSTLEDTSVFFDSLPTSQRPPKINGTYVPFFDVKGQTNKLFPKDKTTIVYTSAYLEDFYNYGWIQNGVFTANLDDVKLPVMAVGDIGQAVYSIFLGGSKYLGQTVHLATDRLTGNEFMQIASEVVGLPYTYQNVDHETYCNQDTPGAKLLGNMFEYMRMNPKYSAALDPAEAKVLITNDNLVSVRSFFAAHKEELLALGPKMAE